MRYLEVLLPLLIIGIGIHMFTTYAAGTPPSWSGLAFGFIGAAFLVNFYSRHSK